jgi:hypothetical protein
VAAEQPDEGSAWHPRDPQNPCAHGIYIGPNLLVREANDIKSHSRAHLAGRAPKKLAKIIIRHDD